MTILQPHLVSIWVPVDDDALLGSGGRVGGIAGAVRTTPYLDIGARNRLHLANHLYISVSKSI